eukprot:GHVU01098187.1.p1 GENE.GHVU01098187.1~~GHVU01098187.1.p1  ORF type:complete len:483 (-),score=81.50 GHVU01098187.1:1764-3212(-)
MADLATHIKNTQATLGTLITEPDLSEKRLSRPTFRFLHKVVMAVMEKTQFMAAEGSREDFAITNFEGAEQRVAFFQTVFAAVAAATGMEVSASPEKVVAGLEPEKTNAFLAQLFAAAKLAADQDKESATSRSRRDSSANSFSTIRSCNADNHRDSVNDDRASSNSSRASVRTGASGRTGVTAVEGAGRSAASSASGSVSGATRDLTIIGRKLGGVATVAPAGVGGKKQRPPPDFPKSILFSVPAAAAGGGVDDYALRHPHDDVALQEEMEVDATGSEANFSVLSLIRGQSSGVRGNKDGSHEQGMGGLYCLRTSNLPNGGDGPGGGGGAGTYSESGHMSAYGMTLADDNSSVRSLDVQQRRADTADGVGVGLGQYELGDAHRLTRSLNGALGPVATFVHGALDDWAQMATALEQSKEKELQLIRELWVTRRRNAALLSDLEGELRSVQEERKRIDDSALVEKTQICANAKMVDELLELLVET